MSETGTPHDPPPPPTSEPGDDKVASTEAQYALPFEFTPERRFDIYMQQRKGYSDGARDAYQRFDQTIVALSGGAIVLSITFLKEIGHTPESLPWLFGSWACFLVASLSAFLSLLTSGEADRERIAQIDCLVESGDCNESKADRLGSVTSKLNYIALALCILGVTLIIMFAKTNLAGGESWPSKSKEVNEAPQRKAPGAPTPEVTTSSANPAASPRPTPAKESPTR